MLLECLLVLDAFKVCRESADVKEKWHSHTFVLLPSAFLCALPCFVSLPYPITLTRLRSRGSPHMHVSTLPVLLQSCGTCKQWGGHAHLQSLCLLGSCSVLAAGDDWMMMGDEGHAGDALLEELDFDIHGSEGTHGSTVPKRSLKKRLLFQNVHLKNAGLNGPCMVTPPQNVLPDHNDQPEASLAHKASSTISLSLTPACVLRG